ncbi:hypothetical protein [Vibrio quintilis]|uniref:Uncharacterized protein n=1 Tax=Vibrio quintilis TaxID=1117707 RepID=A0A1M7YW32_9VIBR|nr:hypothetical protein [Vibrio quintilis]SHO56798.1 hypothetical protein VQ7734_02567 [Vibrio quintilis]
MLNQLLGSLRRFAQLRKKEVKQGLYSSEFAASLVQSYSDSMMKGMHLVGGEAYIAAIQSEANKQCCSVCPGYQKSKKVKSKKNRIPLSGKFAEPNLNMV